MSGVASRGGLVVRVGDEARLLDGRLVRRVIREPVITKVPGAEPPLSGASFIDDEVVAVFALGSERGPAVLCDVDGERVLLTGLAVVRAATDEDSALPPLDAVALLSGASAPR